MILSHYIDNQSVEPPENWGAFRFALNYKDDNVSAQITSTDELIFVLDENNIIRNWFDGLLGAFEPPEYRVEVANDGDSITIFTALIDLTNRPIFLDNNRIRVKLKAKDGTDVIGTKAQALSFRYLDSLGYFKESDYIQIPYVLAFIPNYVEAVTVSIAIYAVGKEIAEQTERISAIFADSSGESAGGFLGAIGSALLGLLRIAISIAYFIALTIALKTLIIDLINSLISPIRYYKGIKLRKLLEVSAIELGYNFESTELAFWDDFVLLPEKENRPDKLTNEKGYPDRNSSLYNCADFLQFYKRLINGKFQIDGNRIRCERKDYYEKTTNYKLPDVLTEEYTVNTDEAKSNLNLRFAKDQLDTTTIYNFTENGTTMQRVTELKNSVNKKNSLLKDIDRIDLPVSLPTRKDELTEIEIGLKKLAKKADGLIKIFDKITGKNTANLSQKIKNRIGMVNLSGDATGIPKLIYFVNGAIPSNYRSVLNAQVMYDKYYFLNTYCADVKNYNQFQIFSENIPIKYEDIEKLVVNKWFKTGNSEGYFEKIEVQPDSNIADTEFRIRKILTTNLKDKIV